MKIKTLVFTGILLLSSHFWSGVGGDIFAQAQANWWYFGFNAGMHFTPGGPVAVTNGALLTAEGSASVSDPNGNLLFYTDGIKVWNRNDMQMPNGTGLKGNSSSSQAAIIVGAPGNTTRFYIFTVSASASADGLQYSIVDMTLAGGLGDVSTKNIPLHTPVAEKIVAINHCNKTDMWIITHEWNSNAFYAYRLTPAGINPVPVISNVGTAHNGITANSHGYLKCSPDGTKLAVALQISNMFELFDFDNITGAVTNPVTFPGIYTSAYGVEFSPDGTKLYGRMNGTSNIRFYQFDLQAGSPAAIVASATLIGTSATNGMGALQLGPDGKIYAARPSVSFLGVITNPNVLGLGCNYVDNGVPLAGKLSSMGLPNCFPGYFVPPVTGSNVSTCAGNSVTLSASGPGTYNYTWVPAAGLNTTTGLSVTASPSISTSYTVNAYSTNGCFMDTTVITVNVSPGLSVNANSGLTNVSCPGGNNGSTTALISGGTPSYTYLWSNGQTNALATGLSAGNYTLTVKDTTGCASTQTVTITEPIALSIATDTNGTFCNEKTGAATANVSGGTGIYSYLWNNGQSTQITTGLAAGIIYTITITDANGCTKDTSVMVTDTPCPCDNLNLTSPNAFSPNDDGENDKFCLPAGQGSLHVAFNYCIKDLAITIYDRWGEKVYESNEKNFCWDGTYKNQLQNTAVFMYYLKATFITGNEVVTKGNVSLIR